MILMPRSWPSRPILATTTLMGRPGRRHPLSSSRRRSGGGRNPVPRPLWQGWGSDGKSAEICCILPHIVGRRSWGCRFSGRDCNVYASQIQQGRGRFATKLQQAPAAPGRYEEVDECHGEIVAHAYWRVNEGTRQ